MKPMDKALTITVLYKGFHQTLAMLYANHLSNTHYDDVKMSAISCKITSLTIVYLTVYSGIDERKHQSSASLAFVRGIHRWPVNSPHKGPVTRKNYHLMTSSWAMVQFVACVISESHVRGVIFDSASLRCAVGDASLIISVTNHMQLDYFSKVSSG